MGWYTGRYSANTRRLVMEETETIYDSDAYNDDLPYYVVVGDKPRLIVPYALDTNDFKFATSPGWLSGEDFFSYLRLAFDRLYKEGEREPKMMSIGLHAQLVGRPGRAEALSRFMDYVLRRDQVWICRRKEIAAHWLGTHPYVQAPAEPLLAVRRFAKQDLYAEASEGGAAVLPLPAHRPPRAKWHSISEFDDPAVPPQRSAKPTNRPITA